MRTQVINTVRACFAALRQIRSVRRSLPQHYLLTLIRTLVITKLNKCNSVLVGTCVYLQDRLQSVLMPPLGLSTGAGRQNTQPLCYGSFNGCASTGSAYCDANNGAIEVNHLGAELGTQTYLA